MEDNEFEEVTIISHTDRPQRVFSEKSIEKLKDQVGLQIVQVVGLAGDTQTFVDDPRLAPGLRELEKLKQDHFGEGEGQFNPQFGVEFISRVAGESGQYLLGAMNKVVLGNGQTSKAISYQNSKVQYILHWASHYFLFGSYNVMRALMVKVIDPHFNSTYVRNDPIGGYFIRMRNSWHVISTPNFIYYKVKNGIARIDRELKGTIAVNDSLVQDFFVCPKTETITTLNFRENLPLTIQRNDIQQHLAQEGDYGSETITMLKKMYSDHFLVGVCAWQEGVLILYLVDGDTLMSLNELMFDTKPEKELQNIRLLAPRQGISCFLVLMSGSLELFCEYRLKLYHLKTLEANGGPLNSISYQAGGLWMMTARTTVVSVRVDFSKCPALQL